MTSLTPSIAVSPFIDEEVEHIDEGGYACGGPHYETPEPSRWVWCEPMGVWVDRGFAHRVEFDDDETGDPALPASVWRNIAERHENELRELRELLEAFGTDDVCGLSDYLDAKAE